MRSRLAERRDARRHRPRARGPQAAGARAVDDRAAANTTLPILARAVALDVHPARARSATLARTYFDRLRVRAPALDAVAAGLSGGNQQKLVLAKWLAAQCRILILDEPTRGVDVGAKAEIHALIDELAARGDGVIL